MYNKIPEWIWTFTSQLGFSSVEAGQPCWGLWGSCTNLMPSSTFPSTWHTYQSVEWTNLPGYPGRSEISVQTNGSKVSYYVESDTSSLVTLVGYKLLFNVYMFCVICYMLDLWLFCLYLIYNKGGVLSWISSVLCILKGFETILFSEYLNSNLYFFCSFFSIHKHWFYIILLVVHIMI